MCLQNINVSQGNSLMEPPSALKVWNLIQYRYINTLKTLYESITRNNIIQYHVPCHTSSAEIQTQNQLNNAKKQLTKAIKNNKMTKLDSDKESSLTYCEKLTKC